MQAAGTDLRSGCGAHARSGVRDYAGANYDTVGAMEENITDAYSAFWQMVNIGKKLMDAHLNYEQASPYPLTHVWTPGVEQNYHVTRMVLSKDRTFITVNESLTLSGIPPETHEYTLGNKTALEWIIDQYQITTDPRSGIMSDPNRADDPQYIVRLVCQVVAVSVETVRLVNRLAARVNLGDFELVGPIALDEEGPMSDYWKR